MNTIITNENGITVKELKEFIKDWPEVDEDGEPYDVWFETGWCRSSPVTEVCKLNHGDIFIGREPRE